MTKFDLIKIIHERVGLGWKDSMEAVEQIFEIIKAAWKVKPRSKSVDSEGSSYV